MGVEWTNEKYVERNTERKMEVNKGTKTVRRE
jgi:hypothetical protein